MFFRTSEKIVLHKQPQHYWIGGIWNSDGINITPYVREGKAILNFRYYSPEHRLLKVEISNITSARKGMVNLFRSLSERGEATLYESELISLDSLRFKSPSEMNYSRLIWKLENPWFSSAIHGGVLGGVFGLTFALLRGDDFRETSVSALAGATAGALSAAFMALATDRTLIAKGHFFVASIAISFVTDWGGQAINAAIG